MLIQKAAHLAISTGKYADGISEIKKLTTGDCNPADYEAPGWKDMGARIAAGQASRSKRTAHDIVEREEAEGLDRQERIGTTRKKKASKK